MAFKFVLQGKLPGARSAVKLDVDVSGDSQGLPVGGEGVVGDWVMEQMMHFWGHIDVLNQR